MNKLLKVLEDRKVFSKVPTIAPKIAISLCIFMKSSRRDCPRFSFSGSNYPCAGEIPPAIRSRCLEIFFRPLTPDQIGTIAANAADKIAFALPDDALEVIKRYATNGREAVNMVQIAAGLALTSQGRRLPGPISSG